MAAVIAEMFWPSVRVPLLALSKRRPNVHIYDPWLERSRIKRRFFLVDQKKSFRKSDQELIFDYEPFPVFFLFSYGQKTSENHLFYGQGKWKFGISAAENFGEKLLLQTKDDLMQYPRAIRCNSVPCSTLIFSKVIFLTPGCQHLQTTQSSNFFKTRSLTRFSAD